MLYLVAAVGAVILGLISLKRPEIILVMAALIVPSGSFHPALRLGTPIGQFSPFQVIVWVSAIVVCVLEPRRLLLALRTVPGEVGLAITVVGLITAVLAGDILALYWVINLGLLLIALTALLCTRYPKERAIVERWLFIGGTVLALSAIAEYLLGHYVFWFGVPFDEPFLFRPAGLSGNALLTGAILATILAFRLTTTATSGVRFVTTGVFLLAIGATFSRSGLLGAAFAIVCFVFARPEARTKLRSARAASLLLGVPALVMIYIWIAPELSARLSGGISDAGRVANLNLAWEQFKLHPVTGLGLGGFKRYAFSVYGEGSLSATVDNAFLVMLSELGLVGFIAFTIVFFRARARRRRLRVVKGGIVGSAIPLATLGVVSLFFDSNFHDAIQFLFVLSLLSATTALRPASPKPIKATRVGYVPVPGPMERAGGIPEQNARQSSRPTAPIWN